MASGTLVEGGVDRGGEKNRWIGNKVYTRKVFRKGTKNGLFWLSTRCRISSYSEPFDLRCGSGFLKISDPALDAIQKLIAHGYIRGESDLDGGEEGKISTKLIESVCKCYDSGDDSVELMVLKTLLSVVTSNVLRIHGGCLLLVVLNQSST